MTDVAAEAEWTVHLETASCTCIRFTFDRTRDSDPWPLSRVVTELTAAGASLAERPRALGTRRGIPLVHSQVMAWCGTTLELEAHHLRDEGHDEVSVTLPPWDELVHVVAREDDVWEMVDVVAAAIAPRFGVIGDGEAIGSTRCETDADVRNLLRRHIGVVVHAYAARVPSAVANAYRSLSRSGMIVVLH